MNKESLILKLYAVTVTGVMVYFILVGFKPASSDIKFEEIYVERINVIEPDGKLKMVISNQDRQHPGMMNGKELESRNRPPGIVFFNEEQDEIGALAYFGNEADGGNQLFMSFDQYKDDQIMQLMQYTRKNGDNCYGLQLWEREKSLRMHERMAIMDSLEEAGYNYRQKMACLKKMNGGNPVVAPRMFVGRNYDQQSGVFLQDKNGIDRLRLYVDSNDLPKLQVLNNKGEVIRDVIED